MSNDMSTNTTPTATITTTPDQAEAAARLVDMYAQAARQDDDQDLKSFGARHLGYEKYLDHCHLLRPADRNPTEEGQRTLAVLRLPHIQDFIDNTDANNLRNVIAGMMAGLQRHIPRHESQYQPGTDELINLTQPVDAGTSADHDGPDMEALHADLATRSFAEVANMMANLRTQTSSPNSDPSATAIAQALQARLVALRFEEVIGDFTQTHEPHLRAETAFHVGTLKIINERDLRLFNYTSHRDRLMALDAQDDLEVVDQLIASADADQLRQVIAGITSRIYLLDA